MIDLGVNGIEGNKFFQLGVEFQRGFEGQGGGVGVGENDGVVSVTVAVLQSAPFC